jgi:flagellar biosynthesis/type III secretory pathway M-ring protein FliF/YscJ
MSASTLSYPETASETRYWVAFLARKGRAERRENDREGSGMDTWVIVLIVAGALVLLAVAVVLARSAAKRRTERQRAEAAEAREDARALERQAAERERTAEEELARAERERAVARGHAQRADEVDPDIET